MAKRRYANDLYRIESTQSGDEIEFCKTFREAMATLKRGIAKGTWTLIKG